LRGEPVTIHVRGLYYWDTVSSAAQMQTNDLVTLALAVPLLILAFLLAQKGSLRGMFLLTGNLGILSRVFHITSREFGFNCNNLSFAIKRVLLFYFQGIIGFYLVY